MNAKKRTAQSAALALAALRQRSVERRARYERDVANIEQEITATYTQAGLDMARKMNLGRKLVVESTPHVSLGGRYGHRLTPTEAVGIEFGQGHVLSLSVKLPAARLRALNKRLAKLSDENDALDRLPTSDSNTPAWYRTHYAEVMRANPDVAEQIVKLFDEAAAR